MERTIRTNGLLKELKKDYTTAEDWLLYYQDRLKEDVILAALRCKAAHINKTVNGREVWRNYVQIHTMPRKWPNSIIHQQNSIFSEACGAKERVFLSNTVFY